MFSKENFIPGLFLLLSLIFASTFVVSPIVVVVYSALAIHAMRGPRQTIEAFTIMFLVLMGNPVFVSRIGRSLRWIVLFAGFGRMLFDTLLSPQYRNAKTSKQVSLLLFFFIAMLPVSILTSKMVLISSFKLVAFALGAFTVLVSFERTKIHANYWHAWFNTYFLFLVLSSGLIFLGGMGFERNGVGFQGILNHPQVFGSIMGMVTAWYVGRIILTKSKISLVELGITVLSVVFLYISQARTGAVAFVGGGGLAFLFFLFSGKQLPTSPRFYYATFALLTLISFVMILIPDQVFGLVTDFIQKRTENAAVEEAFQESRGFLIEASMANFRDYPILGIGFGVPSNYQTARFGTTETIMGMPVSATVEKGFLPSAILEETGLIGALFTIVFLGMLIGKQIRKGDLFVLWLILSSLLINIGEAVFFSLGGTGLMVWLMLGFSVNQYYSSTTTLQSQ